MKTKYESRNTREGSPQVRQMYFNRRHRRTPRFKWKGAKLAAKGTMRSVSKARIDAIFHMIGIDLARQERSFARKHNRVVHFMRNDELRVVNIDDCEEGLRLGDICTMKDRMSETREFIIVTVRRNGRDKHIEKSRFVLHKRHIDHE